jgi:hypothetical protein
MLYLDSGSLAFDRDIFTDANFLGSYITGYPNVEETINDAINLTNTLTLICVEGPDFDSADLNVTTLPNLEEEMTLKRVFLLQGGLLSAIQQNTRQLTAQHIKSLNTSGATQK